VARFKLGMATHTFLWERSLESTIRQASEWGFEKLLLFPTPPHIWPREFGKREREQLRNLLDSLNIEVTSVNPTSLDINPISTNPAIREESMRQVKELIELTADLGGRIYELVLGRVHGLVPPPYEKTWQLAKEAIQALVEDAERHQVVLAVENVPPNGFMQRASEVRRMAEEIDSEWVKVIYDVSNANVIENPAEGIEEVGDYLVNLHVSDNRGAFEHLPVGVGQIDFQAIAYSLEKVNYQGVSIVETAYRYRGDHGLVDSAERLEQWGWTR
jgi:sugar phosphate isomerase/epimerase